MGSTPTAGTTRAKDERSRPTVELVVDALELQIERGGTSALCNDLPIRPEREAIPQMYLVVQPGCKLGVVMAGVVRFHPGGLEQRTTQSLLAPA